MSSLTTAIILAAGFGKRLKPLTDHTPKPLVRVAGQPTLGRLLQACKNQPIQQVIINSHHLPMEIDSYMKNEGEKILGNIHYRIVYEPEILETGGGVKNILPLLGDKPFFVMNGDSFWQDDDLLPRLAKGFDEKKMAGLLALASHDQVVATSIDHGDFAPHALLARDDATAAPTFPLQRDRGDGSLIFCGVQVLTAGLFDGMEDDFFSLNKIYDKALAQQRLHGLTTDGRFFTVGTVADIALAENMLENNS